jgi:hypothetical protein
MHSRAGKTMRTKRNEEPTPLTIAHPSGATNERSIIRTLGLAIDLDRPRVCRWIGTWFGPLNRFDRTHLSRSFQAA